MAMANEIGGEGRDGMHTPAEFCEAISDLTRFGGVCWERVVMKTEITKLWIVYSIEIEGDDEGDHYDGNGRAFPVYQATVHFGQTDASHAGGSAFREAARMQQMVADRFATLIRTGSVGNARLPETT